MGTVAKPVAGLLDFASGTTAALRESLSRFNRGVPQPVRLKRCCVGATGALTCYSLQLARGEEYLMRLNDGDNSETYVVCMYCTYIMAFFPKIEFTCICRKCTVYVSMFVCSINIHYTCIYRIHGWVDIFVDSTDPRKFQPLKFLVVRILINTWS